MYLASAISLQEFEDLDEIIARHIQPMAAFVRDVTGHKYYRDTEGGSKELMDKYLGVEKKKTPNRIPYFMSFSKDYPGKRWFTDATVHLFIQLWDLIISKHASTLWLSLNTYMGKM